MREVVWIERDRIVGGDLVRTRTVGGCPVIVAGDHRIHRIEHAGLGIASDRQAHHREHEFFRRGYVDVGVHSLEHGTDVHRGIVAERREEIHVLPYAHAAHPDEQILGGSLHAETGGAAREPAGVLAGTEDAHPAVGTAEGLEPLEAGVAVMEHPGKGVEMEVEVGADLGSAPLAVPEPADYYRVCLPVGKREL